MPHLYTLQSGDQKFKSVVLNQLIVLPQGTFEIAGDFLGCPIGVGDATCND
jgi:hypothetical protein